MGLPTMMAVCIGVVIVQGAMISGMQGIGIGGLGFIAAMFVALVLAQFNAMSFSELSLMFPQEGTLATYTQKAIGHFPAIVAVFFRLCCRRHTRNPGRNGIGRCNVGEPIAWCDSRKNRALNLF